MLSECNSSVLSRPGIADEQLKYRWEDGSYNKPYYWVYALDGIGVKIQADTMELNELGDYKMLSTLREDPAYRKTTPRLTMGEALKKAEGYLEKAKIEADVEMKPIIVEYGVEGGGCWRVNWGRFRSGYAWDRFDPTAFESICIIFHEDIGLLLASRNIYTPPSASLSVKIDEKRAIEIAFPYVARTQESPQYLAFRMPGFVANRLVSCELHIWAPNWLFDPKRGRIIREELPKETRLCWVVRFGTIDAKFGERAKTTEGELIRFERPDFLIYVDAASGEVVGANFN